MTARQPDAPKDEREEALEIARRWHTESTASFGPNKVLGILSRALLAAVSDRLPPVEETEDSVGDWQCRDFADGWITFPTRKSAEGYQEQTGAMMRYRRFYPAKNAAPQAEAPKSDGSISSDPVVAAPNTANVQPLACACCNGRGCPTPDLCKASLAR